jgi:hypothetical protein
MTRFRWLVGLLSVLVIATIGLNLLTEHRNAAIGADHPADLLKRIETLEARVTTLESQLLQGARGDPPLPNMPKHWHKREFNGAPVCIIPLHAEEVAENDEAQAGRSNIELDGNRGRREQHGAQ